MKRVQIIRNPNPEELLGDRKKPDDWDDLTVTEQLDYIAGRILAEDRHNRGITKISEMRDSGILSTSQYERRIRKEVFAAPIPTYFERQLDSGGALDSLDEALYWERIFLGAPTAFWKRHVLDDQEFGAKRP